MKIALLTWSEGENDPFTPFNQTLKDEFAQCGREAVLVKIDQEMVGELWKLKQTGLDFAVTWQGLAVNAVGSDSDKSIWDEWQIPLFCIHGDHPSQMLENHNSCSKYVRHLYGVSSFAHYANRHINRDKPALMFKMPFLNQKKIKTALTGDYFVFAKNLDDTLTILESWRNRFPPQLVNLLTSCAILITESLQNNSITDHHALIDEVLNNENLSVLVKLNIGWADEVAVFHWIHQELNKFYRNILAEQILTELKDIPLRIYGRGWERYSAIRNSMHEFHAPMLAKDSEELYYSNFGIVDVAPTFDAIHDRTLRAMACQGGFLIGSNWPHAELVGDTKRDLFFDSRPGQLLKRCEHVMNDPNGHHEKCIDFSMNYQRWASHFEFLRTLELLRIQF